MNQTKSIILKEIAEFLKEYFSEEETAQIYSMLNETNTVFLEPYKTDPENEQQINSEMNSGSSLRNQIDKLLSFVESGMSTEKFIELSLGLTQLLIYSGEYDVAENTLEQLSKNELDDFQGLKAEVFLLHSKIEWNRGEWKKSTSFCKKAYLLYNEIDDTYGMSNCENMLGNIAGEKGEINKAQAHLEKALNYIKYKENDKLKAMINNNLGIIADLLGNPSKAKFYYNNAILYYNKTNNKYQEARLNHNIGMLNLKQHNFENAIRYFDESINISLQKGYLSNCAISFISKANAYSKIGKQELADIFSEKALEIAFKINDRLSIADVYRVKGLINKNLDNYELSEEFFENSLRLNEDFQNKINITETSTELAELHNYG